MHSRPTKAIINVDHLIHNYQAYQKKTNLEVFAVVKANAYGHGDLLVAHALKDLVRVFCVSSLDEALALKKGGITNDILIFSYVDFESVKQYHDPQFIFTIVSKAWYEAILNEGLNIRTHIKVDTGMNRIGLKNIEDIEWILQYANAPIEGIYTHFSSADEDMVESQRQIDLFSDLIGSLKYPFQWIHASSTHASGFIKAPYLNAMRLGIGLYGYEKNNMNLKQVMSLKTKVIQVQTIHKGESVGYNQTFVATKDTLIATLPIGYADGLDMRMKEVYIKGKLYPFVGKICMDQSMVRVDESINFGDEVEIWGENYPYQMIYNKTQISPYVLMSTLMARVWREKKVSTND